MSKEEYIYTYIYIYIYNVYSELFDDEPISFGDVYYTR